MDFLNISNLSCPQYVNFNSEILKNEDFEVSPSCSSVKDDTYTENMDTEDENNQSSAGSLQSTFSDSYLGGSSPHISTTVSAYDAADFPVNRPKNVSLLNNTDKGNAKVNKTTKVKPFHFMEKRPVKRKIEENEHVPLAEQVATFHKKTPQRFHTTGSKAFEPTEHWSPEIVIPKSPNLQAAKRRRKVDVISREEQEQKEAEEMKRYQFRARPVNQRILGQPTLLKSKKRTPTRSKNLHLKTAERAAEIYSKKKVEEKPYEFRARPVPKTYLNGPTGLKEKTLRPVTQAKTPNFALKQRAEKWRSESKVDQDITETQTFKALPAPAPSLPPSVKYEKKRTEIQPFSFDNKDKMRQALKEKKIMEEIEKENAVYVFKAQPLPSPSPSTLPDVPKKNPTLPQPFNFYLDGKSSRHNSFNLSLDKTCVTFKAHPATVLEKPPFIPEKSAKQPVEVKEFMLHTDVRASERQKLKEINSIKEHEKEMALQRLKELEEEEERREIQKLRQEIVHKANPIKHYKPVDIQPSSKPPTQPLSPKFKTDERLQSRN